MPTKTEGDVFRALIEFVLTAEEPLAFLRRWNEGSFDICRRDWPEAPEELYPAVVAVPETWALIEELVRVECYKARLHQQYMGKAMPDAEYERFQRMRDERIPELWTQVRAALAATPAQEHATQLAGQGLPVYELNVRGVFQDCTPTVSAFGLPDGKHQLYLSAAPAQGQDETMQALSDLTNVLRERHHGRMPEEVQRAYDKAWAIVFAGQQAAPPAQAQGNDRL